MQQGDDAAEGPSAEGAMQDGAAAPAAKRARTKKEDRAYTIEGNTYICHVCSGRFSEKQWRRHKALLDQGKSCQVAMVDGRHAQPQGAHRNLLKSF